ncbi:MAG: hypothetical protein GX606_03385, partial [Elusimicrobia bacterium]|nr:hypothetical protein [Elusimicrobiota bacterium]
IIILLCGMAISLFFLSQETKTRRDLEVSLTDLQGRNAKIEAGLKEAAQQIEVLRAKNKEADEKINSLMEEIDLEKALSEKIKAENKQVKDALEAEAQAKIDLRQKMAAELEGAQAKAKTFEQKAVTSEARVAELEKTLEELRKQNEGLTAQMKGLEEAGAILPSRPGIVPASGDSGVALDRIVITPENAREGRVLNVDTETEFLIFDMGSVHGVKPDDVMSIYRGKTYLGDVKVTRVQDEMSAADFIPPFSSRKVRKNDQVVPKR